MAEVEVELAPSITYTDVMVKDMVGKALGNDDAAAGWASYDALANADGELTREAFHTLVFGKFEEAMFGHYAKKPFVDFTDEQYADTSELARSLPEPVLEAMQSGSDLFKALRSKELEKIMEMEDEEERTAKYKAFEAQNYKRVGGLFVKFASIFDNAFPILTTAIFRFFDVDGNGTISKEEFLAVATPFITPRSTSDQSDMHAKKKIMTNAFFRMIDADLSGVIEPFEIADLVTDVIKAFAEFAVSFADFMEPIIKSDAKPAFIAELKQKMAEAEAGTYEPCPPYISGGKVIVALLLQELVDKLPPDEIIAESFAAQDAMMAQVPLAAEGRAIAEAAFANINAAFAAKADADNTVSADEAAEIISKELNDVVTANLNIAAAEAMNLTEMLPPPVAGLDRELFSDFTNIGVSTVRSQLRAGGVKRFVEAFVSLVDVNHDGHISHSELLGVHEAIVAFRASHSRATMIAVFSAMLTLYDRDADGSIDESDVAIIFDKYVEIGFALFHLSLSIGKFTALALVLPLLNIAFAGKAQFLGGSASSLTREELDKAFEMGINGGGGDMEAMMGMIENTM